MRDEEECMQEHLTLSESIASISLAIFGLFTAFRGVYWIVAHDNPNDSQLYASLITAAPLYIWGGLFIIGSLLLILSSVFLPRRHIRRRFYVALLVGGLLISVTYFIVAIAGFNNSQSWLTPLQMITLSAFGGVLAFFGGANLWQIQNSKSGS